MVVVPILFGVYLAVILLFAKPATGESMPWTAGGFTTHVTLTTPSPGQVGRTITNILVTSETARTALVDVEIHDKSGRKLMQRSFDQQSFTAGERRAYTVQWEPSPSDQPRVVKVKVGVFSEGWNTLYHWNAAAATFSW
jgi:hypothetical protein